MDDEITPHHPCLGVDWGDVGLVKGGLMGGGVHILCVMVDVTTQP